MGKSTMKDTFGVKIGESISNFRKPSFKNSIWNYIWNFKLNIFFILVTCKSQMLNVANGFFAQNISLPLKSF